MTPLRLSVVIPTYLRPEWLRRAVRSLAGQAHPPDEVIPVARAGDQATRAAIEDLASEGLPFPLVPGVVTRPGFMPPVQEGIRLASGDIVAVLDDDAEAERGWTDGLLRHYRNPTVGAVGGRYINMRGNEVEPVASTRRVGYVDSIGRFVGRMYLNPAFRDPVEVEFLIGGCMSYRAAVARAIEFDEALNGDVAFGYEVDLGLQVRRNGWSIIFDPAVAVRHYSAPRPLSGMRTSNSAATRAYAFNNLRVILRRLSQPRRTVAVIWQLAIGERQVPGLIPWALGPLGRRMGFELQAARPAWAGRRAAIAAAFLDRERS